MWRCSRIWAEKIGTNWNDVHVHIERNIERIHGNLGHSSAQQMEKLFREAMVSDEATEDLKHCSCDACSRLNQPHILEMKECSSRENKTWTNLNIVDAASECTWNPELRIRHRTRCGRLSRTAGIVVLVRRNVSWILIVHRSASSSLIKPKDAESSWTLFLLTLNGTLGKSRAMRGIFA